MRRFKSGSSVNEEKERSESPFSRNSIKHRKSHIHKCKTAKNITNNHSKSSHFLHFFAIISATFDANLTSTTRYPSRSRASIPRVNLTKAGTHRVRIMALVHGEGRRGGERWSTSRKGRRGQTYQHKLTNRRRLDDHKFRITLPPFLLPVYRLPPIPPQFPRENPPPSSPLPYGVGRNSARNASIHTPVARVSHWLHSFVLCGGMKLLPVGNLVGGRGG